MTDTAKDVIEHAISLTLDAECKAADKDEIHDALTAALDAVSAQAAEIERLRGALDSIRRCTSEHGGAGEALRIIHAALSEREP